MTVAVTWDHISIPKSRWFAESFGDYVGPNPLSDEARAARGLGLSFPRFQAPTVEQLLQLHRDMVARSGALRRPFGLKTLQKALAQLKEQGFYGVHKVSFGKAPAGSKSVPMARVLSFSNAPIDHDALLKGLSREEVLAHDQAARRHWLRYEKTGQLPMRPDNVVDLASRRKVRKIA